MDFEGHPDLYRSLIINADFDSIIHIIRAKPELDVIVCELMPEILKFNKYNDKQMFVLCQNPPFKDFDIIQTFVDQLIFLNKFNIIKKLIDVSSADDAYVYSGLYENFKKSKNLNTFFDMAPMFIFGCMKSFSHFLYYKIYPSNNDIYSYIEVLKFGIKHEIYDMLKIFLNMGNYFSFVDESHDNKNLIVVAYSIILKHQPTYLNMNVICLILKIRQFDSFLKIFPTNYNFDNILLTINNINISSGKNKSLYNYAVDELNKYAVDTSNNDLLIMIDDL
jgi:hypothetical protein